MRFKIGVKIGIVLLIFLVEILTFMFTLSFVTRQYQHNIRELAEETRELDLIDSLQLALAQAIMPVNDFLIPGGEPNEPENFKVLSARVEDLIKRLDKLAFDRPEEKEIFRGIKEKFLRIKAISLKIFSIPNAVESIEASRLMEKMDKIVDDASIDAGRFHQFAYQEIDEAEAGIQRFKKLLNLVILVTILFNIVFVAAGLLFFRRTISSPIISLRDAALEIGRGNLQKKVDIGLRDEIGELATSFNKMAEDLKSSRGRLEEARAELEDRVKKRTRDLAQAKQLMERVTEGIEEGIMLLDRDFKILWANKKMQDSYGLEEGDIVGNFCYKVTHHLDEPCKPPYDICPVVEILKTGKPITVTHTHFDKEGNKFYAEVSSYPLRNEKGEISQFIHVARDVTEKIKIFKELEESRAKLKAKLEEIEKFNKLAVGRELRMQELKEKIKKLEKALGGSKG